jgi:hypothetical protein
MSKVKLVTVEGYGTETNPFISEAIVVDSGLKVPDTYSIIGIIRSDFDEDADGSKRVSDDHAPIIHTTGVNHLVGKLLTLADAAFNDREQRRAFKDLIRETTWDWYWGNSSTPVSAWGKGKDISV